MSEDKRVNKKKKCKHDEAEWIKLPKGFSKEDLKGLKGRSDIGMDAFTSIRINDYIRDLIAYHIPDHEAVLLVNKKFGVQLSEEAYNNRKIDLSSDVEIQAWLNAYAKSGFVRDHIVDMDRMRLSIEMIMESLHTEGEKPHDERDWKLIGQLQKELRESTKFAVQLRLGAPVMARVKSMLNVANIEVIENDPNMSNERKKKLMLGIPKGQSSLVIPYMGDENTGGDNIQKSVAVAYSTDKKSDQGGRVGAVLKHNKNGSIDWKGVEQDLKGEIVSNNKEIVINPDNNNNESYTNPQGRSDVSDSQSFFKFVMESGGEPANDDLLPKRTKSGLDSVVEGQTSMEMGSDTRGTPETMGSN